MSNTIAPLSPAFDAATSILDFFEGHYLPLRLSASSIRTAKSYRDSLRLLERIAGRPTPLGEVDRTLIARMMADRVAAGRSAATANKHRQEVLAILSEALDCELIDKLPRIKKLKRLKTIAEAWRPEEVAAILAAAKKRPGFLNDEIQAALFWEALLLLLFNTGLRISAAMSLGCAECSLDRRQIHIHARDQKQKADQRFDLWPSTVRAIRRLGSHRRGLARVFDDWAADRTNVYWHQLGRIFKRILKRAGLGGGAKDGFHKIRRTFATRVVQTTGSVETARLLLGHSTILITNAYVDWSQIRFRTNVAEILADPLGETADGQAEGGAP
jgi:integrase